MCLLQTLSQEKILKNSWEETLLRIDVNLLAENEFYKFYN